MADHGPKGGATVATGLRRREGSVTTLPCGCSSDDFNWLTLCEPIAREVRELKARAAAERTQEAGIDPLLT